MENIFYFPNLMMMSCLNQDDDFNLGILTMKTPEGVFEVDFDEE